jgi:cytochrome oxidase Cu insertion factor (SCO1/SenC/PrrC family)
MKNQSIAVLLLMALVFITGCQTAVEEPVVEEPAVVEEPQQVEEAVADDANDIAVNAEGKKRVEGPFKDMIAPDFTLPDLEGNNITLSDLRGNAVALIFWTSW